MTLSKYSDVTVVLKNIITLKFYFDYGLQFTITSYALLTLFSIRLYPGFSDFFGCYDNRGTVTMATKKIIKISRIFKLQVKTNFCEQTVSK